ncbi:hypothetical protein [Demequina sp. NBRC 110051]|uniref:hypothetical protein n=1 Tax=Demequina sp. NBRC 110051 TaxID=1570340 RepID=UPI00117CE4A6|nr:hypothetical protein [Demequina sp. NBRC 110051]
MRTVSIGGVAAAVLVLANCAGPADSAPGAEETGVGGEAACAAPMALFAPLEVAPGDTVTVTLEGMSDDCYDTGEHGAGPPGEPEPIADVMVATLVGVDDGAELASVDVSLGEGNTGHADLVIPEGAPAGAYTAIVTPEPAVLDVPSILTVTAD